MFVSDEAPAMIGKSNGVAGKKKSSREKLLHLVSTVFFIKKHCVQNV
jgi:hypothetical protein